MNNLKQLRHFHLTDNPHLQPFMKPLGGGDLTVGLRLRRLGSCLPKLEYSWIKEAAENVHYFRYDRNFLSLAAIRYASRFYRQRQNQNVFYLLLNTAFVALCSAAYIGDATRIFKTITVVLLALWLTFLGISMFIFSQHRIRWANIFSC